MKSSKTVIEPLDAKLNGNHVSQSVLWSVHWNPPLDNEKARKIGIGDKHINSKGHTIPYVQTTCDANEKFMIIGAQWPGTGRSQGLSVKYSKYVIITV